MKQSFFREFSSRLEIENFQVEVVLSCIVSGILLLASHKTLLVLVGKERVTSPKSVCEDSARANKRKNEGGLRQEIFILPNCLSRSVFVFARPKLPRAWNRLTSPVPVSHKGKQLPQNELQMANSARFSWL